ncbi:hypothetical protein SCMU_39410 [Sinomonas cyclohexanicum]|uniref:Uncharacterized protein n=1 Tax=Sinomonas cyclohexanicum TaxID=322009 RepID=A0ABM7Q0J3_SINCY|nr:hypothetical protein SCMU_39410 [Corynebacterium cyclohexanicum]
MVDIKALPERFLELAHPIRVWVTGQTDQTDMNISMRLCPPLSLKSVQDALKNRGLPCAVRAKEGEDTPVYWEVDLFQWPRTEEADSDDLVPT